VHWSSLQQIPHECHNKWRNKSTWLVHNERRKTMLGQPLLCFRPLSMHSLHSLQRCLSSCSAGTRIKTSYSVLQTVYSLLQTVYDAPARPQGSPFIGAGERRPHAAHWALRAHGPLGPRPLARREGPSVRAFGHANWTITGAWCGRPLGAVWRPARRRSTG